MKMSSSSLSSSSSSSSSSLSYSKPRRFFKTTIVLIILLVFLTVLHIRYMAPSSSWFIGSSSLSFPKNIARCPAVSRSPTTTDGDSPKSDDDYDSPRVTIIITSSWVPSHPSLDLIRPTIESLSYLKGLSLNETRIIVTVDSVVEAPGPAQEVQQDGEPRRTMTIDPTPITRRLAGQPTVAQKAKMLTQYKYNLNK